MQQPQITVEPDRILSLQLRADHALALLNLVGNMPISSGMAPLADVLGEQIRTQAITPPPTEEGQG